MSIRSSSYPTKVARLIAIASLLITVWFAQAQFLRMRSGLLSKFYHQLNSIIQNPIPSKDEIESSLRGGEKLSSLLLFSDRDNHRRNFIEALMPVLLAIQYLQTGNIISSVDIIENGAKQNPLLYKTINSVGISENVLKMAKGKHQEILTEKNSLLSKTAEKEQPAIWKQQYSLIKESLVTLLGVATDNTKIERDLKVDDFYEKGALIYLPLIADIPEDVSSLEDLLTLLEKLSAKPKIATKLLPDEVNKLRAQSVPLYNRLIENEGNAVESAKINIEFKEKITTQSRSIIELLSRALKRLIENHANILN